MTPTPLKAIYECANIIIFAVKPIKTTLKTVVTVVFKVVFAKSSSPVRSVDDNVLALSYTALCATIAANAHDILWCS